MRLGLGCWLVWLRLLRSGLLRLLAGIWILVGWSLRGILSLYLSLRARLVSLATGGCRGPRTKRLELGAQLLHLLSQLELVNLGGGQNLEQPLHFLLGAGKLLLDIGDLSLQFSLLLIQLDYLLLQFGNYLVLLLVVRRRAGGLLLFGQLVTSGFQGALSFSQLALEIGKLGLSSLHVLARLVLLLLQLGDITLL